MRFSRHLLAAILVCLAVFGAFVIVRSALRDAGHRADKLDAQTLGLDVEAIRKGAMDNQAHFATLRVTWRETREYRSGWSAANEKQASEFEKEAAKPGLQTTAKASLLEQAQNLRSLNEFNRKPESLELDFWSDGRSYQVRVPLPGTEQKTRASFPDNPLTPETLAGAYASIGILSWAPAQTGSLRAWWGIDARDGTGRASISDKTIQESLVNFQFPPLGRRTEAWGPESLGHPVDAVFSGPAADVTLVGSEVLEGKSVMVVEREWIDSSPAGLTKQPGKLELLERVVAWIDPRQGFLPLRVESGRRWRFNGRDLGDPNHWKPHLVVEVQEIAAVDGGFYPKKCIATSYVADPSIVQNVNDIDGLIAGTAAELTTVPYQRTTWEALLIEAHRSMPAAMFIPRFPENTDVVDQTQSKKPAMAKPLEPGDLAPEWQVSAWTDGRSRKVSDFRGKIILLDFWGVWCAPCLQGLPAIRTVQDRFGDRLACFEIHTAGADMAAVKKMLDSKKVTSPSAIDEGVGRQGVTASLYGVEAWPHMVLIDPAGRIAWTSHDPDTESLMAEAAKVADLPWPPNDMSDDELHRLRTAALSIEIEKILASTGPQGAQQP